MPVSSWQVWKRQARKNEKANFLCPKVKEEGLKREDIFVTTKLWSTFHRPNDVAKGLDESLSNLGLDYIDLYLMHW